MRIPESELILNKDGSIYHLNLLPEDLADFVIVVGDPDRVPQVSCYFDRIEVRKQKRELVTHTGYIGKKRISVLSTGMGVGGIDICMNELDALANIDFKTRTIKPNLKSLQIVRLGTCGSLQKDAPVDSIVVSQRALGLDGIANFYDIEYNSEETRLMQAVLEKFNNHPAIQPCYAVDGNAELTNLFGTSGEAIIGTTVTTSGFYAAQGRILRGQLKIKDFIEKLQQLNMTNFEMETSAIFALAKILGHRASSVCAVVANRAAQQFSQNSTETVDKTIRFVLEKFSVQETVSS
ncbi:MAG TPA: nucleoside phosphorylase [Gammaproteobacteria bacterium]|nr:nucleoside phosphorylase [Gammaproteobacteria bacterium]